MGNFNGYVNFLARSIEMLDREHLNGESMPRVFFSSASAKEAWTKEQVRQGKEVLVDDRANFFMRPLRPEDV